MENVKPLKVANLIGKCRNRIALVGLELEGGWNKIPTKARIERDSSVFKNPNTKTLASLEKLGIQAIGELVSQPMAPIGMRAWLDKHYPTYCDQSCGLHIHMSFEDARHYAQLMIPEYQATIIDTLKDWATEHNLSSDHPIWPRLRGENEYCNHSFWPDEQLRTGRQKDFDHFRPGNRYSAIAYRRKKGVYTIECRILPMMETPSQAHSGLKHVIRVTNACLVAVKGRKIPISSFLNDEENGQIVERDREDL